MSDPELIQRMAADLAAIGRARMPFGKYGPANYPPLGAPIYDLPVEYLAWFARKNCFPGGRLGELLRMVHQMKVDGADAAFDPFRRTHAPTPHRKPNRAAPRQFPDQQ